jgi:hypothetical protein
MKLKHLDAITGHISKCYLNKMQAQPLNKEEAEMEYPEY